MRDPLSKYRQKRDFRKTPEPAPKAPSGFDGEVHDFVVHRHDATNLHYDLRLEMEGVLKSFAVPKGFSYQVEDKRLAVRTEDHPIEYITFDGVIPRGEYGAGTMTIWDRGRYVMLNGDGPTALDSGKLELMLYGRRLRGQWHMVRTSRGEKEWLLFKSRDRYSRGPDDPVFPIDLERAREAAFPGRVQRKAVGDTTTPFSDPAWLFEMDFLGRRVFVRKRDDEVELRAPGGRDHAEQLPELVRALRKVRAENALLDGVLVALDDRNRPSRERLDAFLRGDGEAAISLYLFDLLYYDEWDLRALPLRERKGGLASILPSDLPGVLYADHVEGRGEAFLQVVSAAGLPGAIGKRLDSPYKPGRKDDWVRIPVEPDPTAREEDVFKTLERVRARSGRQGRGLRHKIPFTNMKKVLWPDEGLTKGDLIVYYDAVADTILLYLRDRPMHMNRYPDGIHGKSFYQKDVPDHMPEWVETVPIESESKTIHYVVCNDRETLLYLANLASIDLHPWFSRLDSLESPDWAIIDLDPDGSPFKDVVRIARSTGKLLATLGLRPCVKTSGATGIHVYIPLEPGYSYDHARMFCEGIARMVAREHPDIATVERSVARRSGKVYVDFLQNRKGQTIVPAYCARPQPGATVSAPLDWDEVNSDLHPSQFTLTTMPARLEKLGDLFRPALEDRQDLMGAIEALQKLFEK